jgi:SAM-dependent methyltransferase
MQTDIPADHYQKPSYDTKERFVSYWQQTQLLQSVRNGTILNVGSGNGFLRNYMSLRDCHLVDLDIDRKLAPHVCGDVLRLPFREAAFDAVSCFQVLEHLEFNVLAAALREIKRVSKGLAFISLPDVGLHFRASAHLERVIDFSFMLPLHLFKSRLRNHPEHMWEINRKGYPLQKILKEMSSAGWSIAETFRLIENPYHRFFRLIF